VKKKIKENKNHFKNKQSYFYLGFLGVEFGTFCKIFSECKLKKAGEWPFGEQYGGDTTLFYS
jgi:hypothetical protein